MVSSHQIDFGEDGGPVKGDGKILDMWDWITVRDSSIV
jgi:hypothetical protein